MRIIQLTILCPTFWNTHFTVLSYFSHYVQKLAVKCRKKSNSDFLPNHRAPASSPRILAFYSFPLTYFVCSYPLAFSCYPFSALLASTFLPTTSLFRLANKWVDVYTQISHLVVRVHTDICTHAQALCGYLLRVLS